MLNIGRLGAGAAEYYLGEVATTSEAYYTGSGESAGRWVGSLSPALGLHGEVAPDELRAVLAGRHPVSGEQLVVRPGSRSAGPSQNQRLPLEDEQYDIARAAARLHLSVSQVRRLLWAGERTGPGAESPYLLGERRPNGPGRPPWRILRSELERFEATSAPRRGRPGFDLTFRPPKSVSVLWALANDDVRREIHAAHRDSVHAVIEHLERHALVSRRRTRDRVEAIGADGFIAAAFDHRTSRAGDPLLHTHVVTANLTRTVDGRWRTVDARPIYEHARPAGVLYQAHLRHLLSERLGIDWEAVHHGCAEVRGVPESVIRAFSKRRDEIEGIVAEAGYSSARALQAATLSTRRPKDTDADPVRLVDGWRAEAAELGFDDESVARCLGRGANAAIDCEAILDELASAQGLTKHAASFTRSEVIEAIAERSGTAMAVDKIDALADGFLASPRVVPISATGTAEYVWRRGDALERDLGRVRFTTPDLVRMEAEILQWADSTIDRTGPVSDTLVDAVLRRHPILSEEQAAMVRTLVRRPAAIQTVAGRPGAGKTTATAVYVEVLTAAGVPVVGCALAATAAGELERACDFRSRTGRDASTIARLLLELDRERLADGSVIVVDEASMVGTRDLHRLAAHAHAVGGALVLVGDPDQHGAVETGGVFRALVAADDQAPTLFANNRQEQPRDRRAIELFREGNVEAALSRYDDDDLIVRSATASASYDRMVEDWWEHTRAGGTDPMIVGTNHARKHLNARARQRLAGAGWVMGPGVAGRDGAEVAVGDWIVARRNDRRVTSEQGYPISNGDHGRVTAVDADAGAIVVEVEGKGSTHLPPAYVAAHVQHGYARTTYGVQGATLDRAFVHVDDRTGFEEAYVAMTRGRTETRLYLVDGAVVADDESAHRAHASADTGLDTVAGSMRQRRAGVMVHDLDPLVTATSLAATNDLATLRGERRRLEGILRKGPKDVSEFLCDAVRRRDAVSVELKAFGLRGTGLEVTRLRRERDRLNACLDALRKRHERRQVFLLEHQDEVEALRLVRRAELAREATVRAQARVDVPITFEQASARGPIEARAFGDAAEALAVHAERFGVIADARSSSPVGARPDDAEARFSYDRVERLFRAAEDSAVEALRPEPPLSLFD